MIPRWGVLFLAGALFMGALARDGFDRWVSRTGIPPLIIETSVEVTAADGRLLRAYTVADGRWRLGVTLDQIDPLLVEMLLAYEDKNFRDHPGVDPWSMLRVAVLVVKNGRFVSGGSTLTMQVARLIEDGPTGTWRGKVRQARLALALERELTKDQILSIYFNRAPYGGNLEGVRAASLAYFGKEPRRLTPAEAALLVALPQSPERRRPDRDPKAAQAARDRVLARMEKAGVIDHDTAVAALREPVPTARKDFPSYAPHLADRALADDPVANLHHLTISLDVQKALETLASQAVAKAGDRLSIALVVADATTGEIVASVGSAGFENSDRAGFVDMTRALRSPGSALKPFVYAMAFDLGLAHPETLIEDVPTRFGDYAPQNFDGEFRGTIALRRALQLSLNIPAVALTEAVTPARLMTYLKTVGAEPVVPGGAAPGLAVVLGGVGVSLEGLVQAFVPLANGGKLVPLRWRAGEEMIEGPRVLAAEAVWQVTDILAGLTPPDRSLPDRIAWKTGTSYGHRDAWAVGYDGRHVIGVWMGRPDGTPVPGAFGAEVAAPVMFEAFARLKARLDPLPPPPPTTVITANANLPENLQHFRPRDGAFRDDPDAPDLYFPPDGATLVFEDGLPLTVKVRNGRAPFTWLVDGVPAVVGDSDREVDIPVLGPGFYSLAVIDALGRSERVSFRLQ
jgi:penicillin-binding protein 1C